MIGIGFIGISTSGFGFDLRSQLYPVNFCESQAPTSPTGGGGYSGAATQAPPASGKGDGIEHGIECC